MKHTARGMVTAWLALIALQTVTSSKYAPNVPGLVQAAAGLVGRIFDPNVPAIPNHGQAAASSATVTPSTPYVRPPDMPVPAPSPYPTTTGRVGGTYAT